jgi:hypothetical protein
MLPKIPTHHLPETHPPADTLVTRETNEAVSICQGDASIEIALQKLKQEALVHLQHIKQDSELLEEYHTASTEHHISEKTKEIQLKHEALRILRQMRFEARLSAYQNSLNQPIRRVARMLKGRSIKSFHEFEVKYWGGNDIVFE